MLDDMLIIVSMVETVLFWRAEIDIISPLPPGFNHLRVYADHAEIAIIRRKYAGLCVGRQG
jgi:hypothetical protein